MSHGEREESEGDIGFLSSSSSSEGWLRRQAAFMSETLPYGKRGPTTWGRKKEMHKSLQSLIEN